MSIILSIVLVISPIWPIGENPLVGDPYLIVNKNSHELAYILEGEVKQVYSVATGKVDNQTPEGEHTVIVKAVNPYYRKKDIQGGDKNNPLGTRWIGFDAKDTDGRIYGVHGTNNPDSIGNEVTMGCVRMKNEDVEILFEEVPIGTKIYIVSSDESFEELGKKQGAIAN
ncbi:L,D-transpeptidase [Evansella sp. AB-P1]|uniref:L,D-transpeptidase n=1 Tax=Evansella sp. AB-P1 TaxID=3037653 RepID=UPI00241EE01A|nr:L,D-transpeptidase [Evansella sp. AB-P1]MDG5788660.1 L,D-transpeptidase [Evansella sp. AB-P1]